MRCFPCSQTTDKQVLAGNTKKKNIWELIQLKRILQHGGTVVWRLIGVKIRTFKFSAISISSLHAAHQNTAWMANSYHWVANALLWMATVCSMAKCRLNGEIGHALRLNGEFYRPGVTRTKTPKIHCATISGSMADREWLLFQLTSDNWFVKEARTWYKSWWCGLWYVHSMAQCSTFAPSQRGGWPDGHSSQLARIKTTLVKFYTGGFGYSTFEINLIHHNFTGSTEAQVCGAKDPGSFSAGNAWWIECAIHSVSDFTIQSAEMFVSEN